MGADKKSSQTACGSRCVIKLFSVMGDSKTRPTGRHHIGPNWPDVFGFVGTPTSNFSEFPATEIWQNLQVYIHLIVVIIISSIRFFVGKVHISNGVRRGAAMGNGLQHFGPTWPEAENYVVVGRLKGAVMLP